MQVSSHPSLRGLTWLMAGLRIFGQQPIALLMLVFVQFLVIFLPIMVLPMIGAGITAALIPVMYLGLMTAIRATEQGEVPTPAMLFIAFQPQSNGVWKSLMLLGLISGGLTLVAYSLANVLLPMPDTSGVTEQMSPEEFMQVGMARMYPTMLATLLSVPVQMAFWYAPMLVAWHQQTLGKAIFFSWMAVWRNFGAFAMLFIGWIGVILLINIALIIVIKLLGISTSLLTVFVSPILLCIFAGAYCTFWVTYRDVVRQ